MTGGPASTSQASTIVGCHGKRFGLFWETSVSKYMVRHKRPPCETWKAFLENHVRSMVSVDFFTVPTIRFQILYVFLVLAHERRRIVHFAVTALPTAEWVDGSTDERTVSLG
jgi:hypothetical protein